MPHEESNDTSDDETTQDDGTAAMSGSDSPAPARGSSKQRHATDSLESPGDEIGPYKLISQIGEGGFGTVWLAQRRHPFTQRVALKVIKAGMDSKSVLARFDQERQALAVMDHPNIAKVLDGGMTKSGRPYFAMEFVKGEPITEFCDKHKLTITERLKLFEKACQAIQHAHLKGIIHRDIKPGNIIAFATEGAAPGLKVIDFGIAKATSHLMSANTVYTETGQMIGTPDYMSPEQACSTSADVDTRTDIYSLGVLLYELLTGALPFDPKHLRSKAYREIQRIVQEDEPPSPSARLSAIATKERELASKIEKCRKIATAELVRNLRRELEWIPLMAMRKEPRNRYQTAISLADDIRNYLNGAPLVAAPESRMYRLRKTVKRHRALVTGMAAVLLTLVVGLSLATWQWRVATNERIAADSARDGEREQSKKAQESSRAANEALMISATRFGLAAAQAGNSVVAARQATQLEELGAADRFTTKLLKTNLVASIETLRNPSREASCLALSRRGDVVAVRESSRSANIRLIDRRTGEELTILSGSESEDGFEVGLFSPDDSILVTVGVFDPVRLWRVKDGKLLKTLGEAFQYSDPRAYVPRKIALSADGTTLAVSSDSGTIQLWDVEEGKETATIGGTTARIESLAFSPDGTELAAGSFDQTLRLWNRDDGTLARTITLSAVATSIAFSPDGRYLAALTNDGRACRWQCSTGRRAPLRYWGHNPVENNISGASLAFTPDSSRLVVADALGVCVFSSLEGELLGRISTSQPPTGEFAFSEDGSTVITRSSSPYFEVSSWDLSGVHDFYLCDDRIQDTKDLAFSPDGRSSIRRIINLRALTVWDRTAKRNTVLFPGSSVDVQSAEFSRTGALIATGNTHGDIAVLDVQSGAQLDFIEGSGNAVRSISFSADDALIAWRSANESTVRVWDRGTRKVTVVPRIVNPNPLVLDINDAQFIPNGKTLAMAGMLDGRAFVEFLDYGAPQEHWVVDLPDGSAGVTAFSPDGDTFAVSTPAPDFSIELRAVRASSLRMALMGHSSPVVNIAFAGDGKTVASYDADNSVRLWDRETGAELATFTTEALGAENFSFSRDGEVLVALDHGEFRELLNARPYLERYSAIQAERCEINEAISMLSPEITAAGANLDALKQLRTRVLLDPSLIGTKRKALMIGLTTAELATVRSTELIRIGERFRGLPANVSLGTFQAWLWTAEHFNPTELDPNLLNELAWTGATWLPTRVSSVAGGEPFLSYAILAVERTNRKNSAYLDTLARVHWELGETSNAIEIQEETIRVAEAETPPAEVAAAASATQQLADYRATLARYRADPPPASSTP